LCPLKDKREKLLSPMLSSTPLHSISFVIVFYVKRHLGLKASSKKFVQETLYSKEKRVRHLCESTVKDKFDA